MRINSIKQTKEHYRFDLPTTIIVIITLPTSITSYIIIVTINIIIWVNSFTITNLIWLLKLFVSTRWLLKPLKSGLSYESSNNNFTEHLITLILAYFLYGYHLDCLNSFTGFLFSLLLCEIPQDWSKWSI